MRIEKLNEDKIRIFFNIDDLIEKNIDLHTFMSNSMETQDLFLDMLDKAESELGFNTKNYKLIIEALASSEGNFIITVTRMLPTNENGLSRKKKTVKTKIKSVIPNKLLSANMFNSFDDFCSFCTYVKNSDILPKNKLKSASLILYNDKYYLIFTNLKLEIKEFKSLYSTLTEFSSAVKNSIVFERKLTEYGKVIFKKDAINECIKYFC